MKVMKEGLFGGESPIASVMVGKSMGVGSDRVKVQTV